MTRIRTALAAAALLAITLAPMALAPSDAAAAEPHRAMVVVDTGTTVHRQVITFTSDSVSGIQALELAGAQPVVYSFAGQGGAVCRLYGTGRDAGPSCLGGADGDNRYWAYFRAPAGTGGYTYSRSGAGATQVHDGDVEGWKFGTGAQPPYAALPLVPTTTTAPPAIAPPARGAAPAVGGGAGSPGATAAGATTTAPPPGLDPTALAAFLAAQRAATTTTTAASADGSTRRVAGSAQVEAKRAERNVHGSVMEGSDDGGGGGAGSLVIFGLVAVALVGGGLLLRRSRRRPVP